MSDSEKKSGALQAIVVAVIVALAAGSSAPWWWTKVFPSQQATTTAPPDLHPVVSHESRPKRGVMGSLEGGTNRNGSDLSTTGLEVNSAEECSRLCAENVECRAMTFVKHPDSNGGICWQKGAVPSPTGNPGMVSAVKLSDPRQ